MKNFLRLSPNHGPLGLEQIENGFRLADGTFVPEIVVRTVIIILTFYVGTSFLLSLIRLLFNYFLKNKLINKGLMGKEAEKLFKMDRVHEDYAIKWFLLFLGTSIGLGLVSLLPFGWISVALLFLCLSISFLAYFFYLKIVVKKG